MGPNWGRVELNYRQQDKGWFALPIENVTQRRGFPLLALGMAASVALSACSGLGLGGGLGATVQRAAFTSSEYGVPVSERVTTAANPARGGGRYHVGKPYTVRGTTYYPAENPNYSATGNASWYGADFHGRRTANGEIFSANAITAAHPTLPLPSYVRVTNLSNNRSLIVRVNDRGPYVAGRIIDLSHRAAELLGYVNAGSAPVKVEYVGRAPLEGDDTRTLLASYSGPAASGGSSQLASSGGSNTVVGMTADFFAGLFSYAPAEARAQEEGINAAHAAANAMAAASPDLAAWAASVDADTRPVEIALGAYADPSEAEAVAIAFAALGAVDEIPVTLGNAPATSLVITRLKPGVVHLDVIELAQSLGLAHIVR